MSVSSNSSDVPKGLRFSQVYLAKGQPISDSPRFRLRFAALISEFGHLTAQHALEKQAEIKLGVRSPYSSAGTWRDHLQKWALHDVLDLITVAHRMLPDTGFREQWISEFNEIFADLSLAYRVDEKGGVHPYPDEEFVRNRNASIAALQSAKYDNVRNEFETGSSNIGTDNKTAIRRVFAATEGLFRQLFPRSPRLTASECEQLLPKLQALYKNDPAAQGAAAKTVASFRDWVDACHFYRHEQGQEQIAEPPLSLTVHLVSMGASFIRLLTEIEMAD